MNGHTALLAFYYHFKKVLPQQPVLILQQIKASGENQMVGKLQQLNSKCPDSLKHYEPDIFTELCSRKTKQNKKLSAGLKRP